MLQEEIRIPVYFAEETETLLEILNEIQGSANADEAASAFEGKLKKKLHPNHASEITYGIFVTFVQLYLALRQQTASKLCRARLNQKPSTTLR